MVFDWLPTWGNWTVSLASYCVAAGILWRYIVVKVWRGARRFIRGIKALTAEVEEVRRLVSDQHVAIKSELTDDGNGSLKNNVRAALDKLIAHDERLLQVTELIVAHVADEELNNYHLVTQLRERGIEVTPLNPHERWRWINKKRDDQEKP